MGFCADVDEEGTKNGNRCTVQEKKGGDVAVGCREKEKKMKEQTKNKKTMAERARNKSCDE